MSNVREAAAMVEAGKSSVGRSPRSNWKVQVLKSRFVVLHMRRKRSWAFARRLIRGELFVKDRDIEYLRVQPV